MLTQWSRPCGCCGVWLDIEEVIFDNQCWVDGSTQGYDREDYF
jgi:hypothetical protein